MTIERKAPVLGTTRQIVRRCEGEAAVQLPDSRERGKGRAGKAARQ
jgi:hypothetical protein